MNLKPAGKSQNHSISLYRLLYVEEVNKNLKEKEESHVKLAEKLCALKSELLQIKYQTRHFIVRKPGIFGNSPIEVNHYIDNHV